MIEKLGENNGVMNYSELNLMETLGSFEILPYGTRAGNRILYTILIKNDQKCPIFLLYLDPRTTLKAQIP